MAINIISATHHGLDGVLINVEVDIMNGLPSFAIVGLPNASVKEARERVRAAIVNSGFKFPLGRIIINLAPADVKKVGTMLDLPIALGILMVSNQIKQIPLDEYVVFGELSLNGDLKGVKGSIPIIFEGDTKNKKNFIFPLENLKEIRSFMLGNFYPFRNLKEVVSYITNEDLLPYEGKKDNRQQYRYELDYGDIFGQYSSKRAMEIVAAGRHNVALYGSPGSGKSMLANALPSILPPLTIEEQMEVAKIYSVSGLIKDGYFVKRPFRAPHHSITKAALIGGGSEIRAGEITLAHNGVLFLDEMLEFRRNVLDSLRQPLEEGVIHISRANESYILPSKFVLVAAFNPCPCGKMLEGHGEKCICTPLEINRYASRMSGALMDRIDLLNYVPRVQVDEVAITKENNNSDNMRQRVMAACEMQKFRLKDTNYEYNSEIVGKDVLRLCRISIGAKKLIQECYQRNDLSIRAYTKIIKVARTMADLDGTDKIEDYHIMESLNYRKNIFGKIV